MPHRVKTSTVDTLIRPHRSFAIAVAALGIIAMGSTPLLAQANGSYAEPASESGPLYHHASTFDQGYLDGRASVVRSVGLARYNSALAARHNQAAYQHALDNAVKKVDTYYARKERRREYLTNYSRAPLTEEQILQHNQMRRPKRTSPGELSESTGKINWPEALSEDIFARERDRLDALFAQRSPSNSGRGTKNLREIRQSVDRLMHIVGHGVRSGEIDSQEFFVVNRFLKSLRYEAHFPRQNMSIASN